LRDTEGGETQDIEEPTGEERVNGVAKSDKRGRTYFSRFEGDDVAAHSAKYDTRKRSRAMTICMTERNARTGWVSRSFC
jgi:hypothetical protein